MLPAASKIPMCTNLCRTDAAGYVSSGGLRRCAVCLGLQRSSLCDNDASVEWTGVSAARRRSDGDDDAAAAAEC